jgi:hypothetical protein
VAEVAAIRESSFCAGCHQFRVPAFHPGGVTMTDTPMQSTWTEWDAWGGSETCQDCHMPQGSHAFRGAHDVELLRGAVSVGPVEGGLRVTAHGVGHHFPTGDLFRHLTLEVEDRDGWRTIATFGRTFEVVMVDGLVSKRLVADTSLRPGVPVDVPLPGRVHGWRLRYHYTSAKEEAGGRLPESDLVVTLTASRATPD